MTKALPPTPFTWRQRAANWARREFDTLALLLSVALLTAGLWQDLGWRALVVPGAVILWLALPSRHAFVIRHQPPAGDEPEARRKP